MVGLMSDSHDNVKKIEKAVNEFNSRGVEAVLHAGDYVSPFTPRWFEKLNCKLYGVWGNCEGERELLTERFGKIGHEVDGFFKFIELNNLRFALIHGHQHELLSFLRKLLEKGEIDLLVFGHSHRVSVEYVGKGLAVNPGECCGYLSGTSTIMVFDTGSKVVERIVLD